MDIVTVIRYDQDFVYRKSRRFTAASQGLWPGRYDGMVYSMACKALKEGVLAPSYSERRFGGTGDHFDEAAMFDPTAPLPTGAGC
jgi:hypothetical protein